MQTSDTATVTKFREFSSFFQFKLAQLGSLLKSTDYSVQDGRILYEINRIRDCCATDLQRSMLIDPGFLSHKLKKLTQSGLVSRKRSERDNRVYNLQLTAEGKRALDSIESIYSSAVDDMLSDLDEREKRELRQSMEALERLLDQRELRVEAASGGM